MAYTFLGLASLIISTSVTGIVDPKSLVLIDFLPKHILKSSSGLVSSNLDT
jgi:hypothetical protein